MLDIARNFAKTKLTASALDSDTTLTVADGSVFGATPFNLVIFDGTDPVQAFEDGDLEIVRCTNVATNTLTVVRAQEDTTAIALGIDYTVFQGLTARAYNDGQKRFSLMAENVDTVANGDLGDVKVLYENLVILGSFDPNANNNVWSIAIQSDGKIVIGGQLTNVGGTARNRIARLNTDGTLDTGFDPNANSTVYKVVIQSDGKIVIGGNFTTVGGTARNYIARLNTDGTLDTGFDPNAGSTVDAIAIQSDGKILIGGQFTTVGGTARNRIARLNTDGTLDTGFDPNSNNLVSAFAIQSDDKILVGGAFSTVSGTTRNGMALLNTDGTLDSGFNPNLGPQFGRPYDIVIQADGKIVIGGTFTTVGGTTRNRIARLNTDGTLDTGYDPNADQVVNAVTIDSNGKIIIGGAFATLGGVSHPRIARLNTDGTLDASINPSPSAQVRAVAIQSDGKILVGGDFTTIGGLTRNRIARIEFGDFYGLYVYTDSWKLISSTVL